MRRSYRSGVSHGFCTICGSVNCTGGDGLNIPDHTPDMDSLEEPGSISVICNICGKPVTHDSKGDDPSWRQIVDAYYEGPEDIGSNHDDEADFCNTCWETKIKPLFKKPEVKPNGN